MMSDKKKVGYSFWGFLGDIKFDPYTRCATSTPDGNATYSWSIINAFADAGYDVIRVMPDRDATGVEVLGKELLFSSFACDKRVMAYESMVTSIMSKANYSSISMCEVFKAWNAVHLYEADAILHEWRMEIPGRNDYASRSKLGRKWQPDLFIQDCLIEYCSKNDIKLVVFDLDYKLSRDDIDELGSKVDLSILELGDKWAAKYFARHVEIPLDFTTITEFEPKINVLDKVAYVGSRYERDWCIDKYVEEAGQVAVYGNWLEGGRDSANRWPDVDFRRRLQACELPRVYQDSATTVLLAKEDYCRYHFMTMRILEAVWFCCVPLFIEEYGTETIAKYAGDFASMLTVRSAEEVEAKANALFNSLHNRQVIISYMRNHLAFMHASNFVNTFLNVIGA